MTGRGVAVVEVDGLALVATAYGRAATDDVLREVGRRLAAQTDGAGCWRSDGPLYVFDGQAARLGERAAAALRTIRQPVKVGDDRLYVTASAGLATGSPGEAGDLVGPATSALRSAQAAGGDRAAWHDAAPDPAAAGLRLVNDLRRGIDGGELRLHFRPEVAPAGRDVAGIEAVARWQRPGVGLLAPAEFADAADRAGGSLAAWVAEQACRTAASLAGPVAGRLTMSIGLSARQLADPASAGMVRAALHDSGCDPSRVVVDVDGTASLVDTGTALATLRSLKALGVGVGLAAFGTGTSSLTCLRTLPAERITIGRSFVSGLGTDPGATAIVASTVLLAHSLGVRVVAEGVDTEERLTLLREMGCDLVRGPLVSAPLTLGALQHWLRERPAARRRRAASPAAPETGRILRLHGEGASLHTIAGALNVEGRRTADGLRWSPKSVARIVTHAEFSGSAR